MMEQTAQREVEHCGFIKTVLMLSVALYHSCLFWTGDWFVDSPVISAPGLVIVAEYLNSFHIYAFTLVSGYLFCYLKLEEGKYSRFIPFLANKAKRLMVPYVFVAAVWVVPVSILFSGLDWSAIFTKYVLATAPSQLWFLVMLFVVFAAAWPLTAFFAKHDLGGAMLVAGMYGAGILVGILLPNVFCIWTACRYMVFFWLGFKLRQKWMNLLHRVPIVCWIAADVVLFITCKYISEFDGHLFTALYLGFEFVLHIVGALMTFFLLQKLAMHVRWQNSWLWRLLEKNSMIIYLFHQQVIYFLLALLNGYVNPYIHVGLNFLAAVTVPILVAAVLRRFPMVRFLLGEK